MIDEAYIRNLAGKLSALETQMADPAVAVDRRKTRDLVREHSRLKRIIEKADRFLRFRRDMEENRSLTSDPNADPELKKIAADEADSIAKSLAAAEKEMRLAFLPPDRNDSRNVIIEIRAGTGGDEAAIFAGDLFRMYSKYCESRKWRVGMIDASPSNAGGYKEVVLVVEGSDVFRTLKYEGGVHRVQRVPVTEAQGRIHTSAATVAVMPEVEEEDEIVIPPEDMRMDIFCSSGPGGQSVNTTYSAVRITHLPTGIIVQSQDERSQRQNKEKAMRVLMARVLDKRRQDEAARLAIEKRTMIGSGDRSERIRTYNFPQNRLTDHRINLTLYVLERVMEGDLQQVLDALYEHDTRGRLDAELAKEGGQAP